MGDFNIDVNLQCHDHDKLEEFCNLFDLSSFHKNSFQKSGTTETGLSEFYKLISTFFKSQFSRLSPKAIYYYKNFDESKFIEDLIYTDFSLQSDDSDKKYSFLTRKFSKIVEKHTLLWKKFISGNHAAFINKELRQAIYTRSRLRNKFCKNPIEREHSSL